MRKLEICCYSIESVLLAEKAGAHRIELCDNYFEGGTTPSYATIKAALEKVKIPIHIIIRPRGGDFLYSELEYKTIKEDILQVKKLGANGVVIGFLLKDGEIDLKRTKEVFELAKPMEVTFHRAFDMCKSPFIAREQLKEIGIHRILTSGTKGTALEGIETLSKLVKLADNEIIILPGGGINETNLEEIMMKTNAVEFHSSAKTFEKSSMIFFNEGASMGGTSTYDEYNKISVSAVNIKKMIEILN